MNPILVDLGFIQIHWYSLFIFVAFLVAGTLVLFESKRYEIEENVMLNMFFWTFIVSIIGARLYYVVFNWEIYSNNLTEILKIWEGGLAIHGGLLAGLIFIIFYSKKHRIKPLYMLDFAVVGVIIGQAIGRWGNFFNGEAYGTEVARETLQSYPIPEFIVEGMSIGGIYRHPTFLYELLWCILGFILLLVIRRLLRMKAGQIFCVYLVWYGLGRVFIEMLRADSLMFGQLKVAQIVSLIMIAFGTFFFLYLNRGSKFSNLYKDTKNIKIEYNIDKQEE